MYPKYSNTTFTRSVLSLIVLFVFLAPLSISLTAHKNEFQLATSFSLQTVVRSASADQATVNQKEVAAMATGKGSGSGSESEAVSFIGRFIGTMILSTAGSFTYVGGKLLDVSLKNFVFGMGAHINDPSFGGAIDTMWKLIRDIANLAFIFGFIYLGIKTIIDPESATIKRTLTKIITGAFLINFSLFFVKIIIDFANFTSLQIYTSMTTGGGSISETIMNMLGLVTLFSTPDAATFQNVTGGGMVWFYILGAVLLFIAAFIFIATAILIVVRFVTLVFIMVASPILFAATVFPQTEHHAKELWRKLLSSAFFVPVYLLLTLVSIKLMQSLNLGISGNTFVDALGNTQKASSVDSMGMVLNFTVIIFFLVESLLIAKKFGITGADMAIGYGKDLRARGQRYIGNASLGAVAKAGRATVGRGANKIANSDKLKDTASTSWIARQGLKAARSVSDVSFDARNVGGLGKSVGIGEGSKGGYVTKMKEVQKKEEEFAKSLGEVGDDDVRVEARKKEWEAAQRTQKAETIRLRDAQKQEKDSVKRAELQTEIDKLEKNSKDKQIEYEKEKQRRVIGSTFANVNLKSSVQDEVASYEDKIKTKKAQIKREWEGELNKENNQILHLSYDNVGKFEKPEVAEKLKMERRKTIEALKKELSDLEKENRKFLNEQGDQGYAGVLEGATGWTSWPIGRLVVQEAEAGKAIRKTAEKGLPKVKEA